MRHILIILLVLISIIGRTQEPQFKFWLAFEDAKHERDTVWIVLDSLADPEILDTIYGEDSIQLDSGVFQVFFGYNYFTKIFATDHYGSGTTASIRSKLAQSPITVRWDTNQLLDNNLPFALKRAYLENSFLYFNGYPFGYDLIHNTQQPKADSIVLEYFEMGGGPASHFPMDLVISSKKRPVGLFENDHEDEIHLFPIPAKSSVTTSISNVDFKKGVVQFIDAKGQLQIEEKAQSGSNDYSIAHLKSGLYYVRIVSDEFTNVQKLIVN